MDECIKRDSILLYRSQCDALRGLPPDQFKASVMAIWDYGLDGIEETDDPVAAAMLGMAKPLIDKNNRRYANGIKGGRPETKQKPNDNQTVTKQKPTDNLKEKGEKRKDNNSLPDGNESMVQTIVDEWNTLKSVGIAPIIRVMPNSKRRNMINARIRQYGLENVIAAIRNCKVSRFLQGHNAKGWAITFDWFIKPENFQKVLEGNYADKQPNKKAAAGRFANFEQREYDYNDLERQLLKAQGGIK